MIDRHPILGRHLLDRREFLGQMATGLSGIALASMLADREARSATPSDPMAPRPPHFPGKAKRVLHLFCTGADVLDGVAAELTVVELQVGLAVARRAPHIRADQDQSQFVDEVVQPPEEPRPELRLGAAVDIHEYRPGALPPIASGPVDERRDLPAVEARVLDPFGLGEGVGVEAGGLAGRPAGWLGNRNPSEVGLEGIRIRGGPRAGMGEPGHLRSRAKAQTGDNPGLPDFGTRKFDFASQTPQYRRAFGITDILLFSYIKDMIGVADKDDPAGSSLIDRHGDPFAVVTDLEGLDVVRREGQSFAGRRKKGVANEVVMFIALIAEIVDRFPVRRPLRMAVGRGPGLRNIGVGSDRPGLAGVHLDDVDPRILDRSIFDRDDLRPAGRPVGDGPLARDLLEAPDESGVVGRGDVEVHVAAVPGVAAPGQERTCWRPLRHCVSALAVGDPADAPGFVIVKEKLVVLGAALVGDVEELIVPRPGDDAPDPLLEEGQLRPGAAGRRDKMDLRDIRESREDVHPRAVRGPVLERRRADLLVS